MTVWGQLLKVATGVYENRLTGVLESKAANARWLEIGRLYARRRGKTADLAKLKSFSVVGVQDSFGIDEDDAIIIIDGFTDEYEDWLKGGMIGARPVLYDQL